MTEREKMVEEMAKEIALIVEKESQEWAGSRKTLWGFYEDTAYAILDKCYRKVPDGARVLTKEELVKTMESGYVYDTTSGDKINLIKMAREIEREETAREIFNSIAKDINDEKDYGFYLYIQTKAIHEYGVEVEE